MARIPKGQSFSVYTEPSFQFWYDEKWYTEQGAKTILESGTKEDISTLRSEYTRMRDVAQKRLKRLAEKYPESKAYQQNKGGFAKLRDIAPQNLAKAFSQLSKFVRASTSSVTGQRKAQEKTTATLNKAVGAGSKGADGKKQAGVTKENYWRVMRILEAVRQQKLATIYGSDRIVTLAETTLSLSQDQFEQIIDNLDSFLKNTDILEVDLAVYMHDNNIDEAQSIDIDDFMTKMGYEKETK